MSTTTGPAAADASAAAGLEGLDFVVSPRVMYAARADEARERAREARLREAARAQEALRAQAALDRAAVRHRGEPLVRPLRVFAIDPSAGVREGRVAIANVPYEPLEPGPSGAYLEVVDEGLKDLEGLAPEPRAEPLHLDAPDVLINQGLTPSATDPLFRAQMAYAVCSATLAAFRRALGREPAWGFEGERLRVHACCPGERNASYDGGRRQIRLGAYIGDATVNGRNVPNQVVCTVLSHDIIVHEMAHAMLDGMRARFLVASNPDVLAFHEAFADMVALFQRFSYREVVREAIRQTRGSLDKESVLAQIGRQFAQTAGIGNALRSAILDSGHRYDPALPPHALGEVLLAAIFGAWGSVFRAKAGRYVRLATNGTGVLPDGELPELLVDRLTDVATELAGQFLTMCIRAIDYCPPVDITFGEYLRAIITADADLVPDDPWAYREALVDAFRARGILPANVRALTQDALLWEPPREPLPPVPKLSFAELRFRGDPGRPPREDALREQAVALGAFVTDPRVRQFFGFAADGDPGLDGDVVGMPVVESIRTSRRVGPGGQVLFDLVAEVIQHRRIAPQGDAPGFDFYGGSTIILDPEGRIRYLVRKSVMQPRRVESQREFVQGRGAAFWLRDRDAARAQLTPHPEALAHLHTERPRVERVRADGARG